MLEYRGYRIEDLASQVSYEETAFLLLHGDLPNRAQLREFDDRLRGSRELPGPLIGLLEQIPEQASPMDVLRTSRERPGSFRPRAARPPNRPRRQRPQGRADDRPDGDGDRFPGTRSRGAEPGGLPTPVSTTPPTSCTWSPARSPPSRARAFDALAGPLRRARAQRVHLLGPGHGVDALGHLLGSRGGDRHAQGSAARRGQRGGLEGAGKRGLARECRPLDR